MGSEPCVLPTIRRRTCFSTIGRGGTAAICFPCGWVSLSKAFTFGTIVKSGQVGTYSIQFRGGRWIVGYNGVPIGYYPGSEWDGKFTKIGKIQAFGEVESSSKTTPHTQMGNGILGTKPGSAVIKNFKLIGGAATKPFTYFDGSAPKVYKIGKHDPKCLTSCGMAFGGPGY